MLYKQRTNLKLLTLELVFILSFLPFLTLSMWGGGVENIFSGDPISLFKLSIRILGILVISTYLIKYSKFFNRFLIGPNLIMAMFLLLATISIIYSSNKFYSAFRLIEHITFFVLSIVLIYQYDQHFKKHAELILNRMTSLLAASLGTLVVAVWIFLILDNDVVWHRMASESFGLGGMVIHVHTLSIASAILFFILISKLFNPYYKKKYLIIFMAVISAITIALTLSRTGYIMFLLGCFILIYNTKNLRKYLLPILFIVTASFSIFNFTIFEAAFEIFLRQQNFQELIQLSSRTIFWQEIIIDTFEESPFLGYGYQMMSHDGTTKVFESLGFIARGNAHNTFVQTFSGLGVIGLALLILNILLSITTYTNFRKIYTELYKSHQIFMIMGLILLTLVASLTQYGIVGMTTPVVPVYLLCISYLSYFSLKDRIHI